MASDRLYELLSEALSQPSKKYRAAQEGLAIPKKALEGYEYGAEFMDKQNKRKQADTTLEEMLAGTGMSLPEGTEGFAKLKYGQFEPMAKLASGIGDLQKVGRDPNKDFMTKFQMQQDAINKRQKDRQNFIREMVGSKGNKDAVNQAKNAVQGLGYVNDLWDEMDKLSPAQKALASTDLTGRMFPTINTLKKNVRRTAGFSEGGKNLTANELEVVVDSFEPTALDNPESRKLKKKIASDFYSGTIDLYEAAKLLGPAGAKIQAIADQQRKRQSMGEGLLRSEAGIGGSELDSIFSEEGVR